MSFFYNYELAKYLLVPPSLHVLFNVLLVILLFIVLLLKGLALWRSARLGQKVWFWIFMFVNTLGILEIVYLIAYKDGFKEIKEIKKAKKQDLPAQAGSKKSKEQEIKEEKRHEIEEEIINEN